MPRKNQYQWKSSDEADGFDSLPPSRSEKKRQSIALQNMGEELTRLGPQEVKSLDLPADLKEALTLYSRIGDHEGRRRQMQFIGRVMREIDPAPIRAMLDARREVSAAATAALHKAEQWRDRLLAADEAELTDLVETLLATRPKAAQPADYAPAAAGNKPLEAGELRTMARAARKEAADNSTPQARRALFRAIHKMLAD
ncbi:ribosome biogenesis factor YjgA [Desulfovibrio desulfuricans]|uniref:ribosome biogenesis factor YjgA n=1 Tax=Desulfovibrio desulfuricans TaxID=876 RepID=UPI0035ADDFBE